MQFVVRIFLGLLVFALSTFGGVENALAKGKSVTYKSGGLEYEGYVLKKSKKAPTVIVLHDWDGLTDYEKKRAQMLEKEGFSVFAPDLFGKGIRPTENKDKMQHTGELYKDRKKMRRLITDAITTAKNEGLNTKHIVVMGYCFGGAAALEFARSGYEAKGFVTFHGGLTTPEGQSYKESKGKILVFHGSSDDHITMDHFAQLTKELEKHRVAHEMTTFGGAPHAFTVFESPAYRKAADEQSWGRFIGFLKNELK